MSHRIREQSGIADAEKHVASAKYHRILGLGSAIIHINGHLKDLST